MDAAESRELLEDFLNEASTLLEDVEQKLVELEHRADDRALLNDIFRGFHTIKGGAGFLDAQPLVDVCHRTETIFDQLRSGKRALAPSLLDLILEATSTVRAMFGQMKATGAPDAADPALIAALTAAINADPAPAAAAAAPAPATAAPAPAAPPPAAPATPGEPDWNALHAIVTGIPAQPAAAPAAPAPATATPAAAAPAPAVHAAAPAPVGGRKNKDAERATTLRIDVDQFDKIFNLSGEMGLIKNRIAALRTELVNGKRDNETVRKLDTAVNTFNALVGDLQNLLMQARMQPVGRVFQRYLRLTRDLARQLSKDVELQIDGAETGIDKTMLDELYDPLVHLIRNAVDHGIESAEERVAAGKPAKSILRLSARQLGDQIVIEMEDDGRGMRQEVLRQKAVEKGLLSVDEAAALDEQQALNLVFLPGFSTKSVASSVSGRGVGMDVVRTNIAKLKGRIDLRSVPGRGTCVRLVLPLTLAVLPVLMFRLGKQTYALPLAQVREIIRLRDEEVQYVSGRPSILLRGQVLPLLALGDLVGGDRGTCAVGAVLDHGDMPLVLATDSFVGQDDVLIKALDGYRPPGVAGATISADGSLVLVLDLKELLDSPLRHAA
ncbi:MAG: chemotaxis protein CheA [Burkholderiales bacterium]